MEDSAPRRMEKPSQRPTFRSSAGRSRRACRGCRLAFLLHYFGCLDLSLFSLILNFLFICLPSVCLLAFSGETSGVFGEICVAVRSPVATYRVWVRTGTCGAPGDG